jgi:hypothetical protein
MTAGDLVYTSADGETRTVSEALTTTTATLDSAAPTGSGVFIKPITATVRPRSFVAPNQVQKFWTQVTAEVSTCTGVTEMSASTLSSVVANSSTLIETPVEIDTLLGVTRYNLGASPRALQHSQSARGYRMLCEFAWKHAFGQTALEAIFAETREGKTNTKNLAVSP